MTKAIEARGRVVLLVSFLCSLGLVAAFTSPASGAATSPARPAARRASVTGVTAHRIVLGATTPLTGPAAPGYDEIAPATNAVFEYVNAHGGIYGRKIDYLVDNDEYDPALTVHYTEQLVEQDDIFADVGSLGTPTQLAVQGFLNSEHVPQLFIESGCACWSKPKQYPESFGWQPDYIVEGKILGQYVAKHMSGEKVGYLYQDDEFGEDGVRGLDEEIPKSSVASEQTYQGTSAGLAAGLGSQISAIKASGAKVVVLYTIPAATALALLAAAELNYHPQWVVSSVGADPPTLTGLLVSYSKGTAGASLLNGMISNAYLPPETDSSNAWIRLSKSILTKYDKSYTQWDGNTEYGAAIGYSMVELLEAAGKHLTRSGIISTLAKDGSKFAVSSLVPFTYSKGDHYGLSGSEVVRIDNGVVSPITPVYVATNKGPITKYTGKPLPIPSILKG